MTQTLAIFLDAYRSLNAKKMFWIVLALSGLVVAAFAMLGINEDGLSIAFWQLDGEWAQWINSDVIAPATFYKLLFSSFGINIWLSTVATILALISTAGIFPDLVGSGSIDLVLCKPISRLRLFATQYVAGLLFVTLQVTVFCLACFLLIGIRGGSWEPGLFIAVPLVVCFFSYLFSVCVYVGVKTRSTLAALLTTLLFWVFAFGLSYAELFLEATAEAGPPSFNIFGEQSPTHDRPIDPEPPDWVVTGHRAVFALKSVMPKTTETVALLERGLVDMAGMPSETSGRRRRTQVEFGEAMQKIMRRRSATWVIGTSLLFELVVLAAAAWIFCRRDF